MGCKNSKVTPLKTPTPPPDFRRVSERRSGRFSRVHEPRYMARVAEDMRVFDLEGFDDSISAMNIRSRLRHGQYPIDEARWGTQNHRPSVPRHTRGTPPPLPRAFCYSPASSPEDYPASSPEDYPASSPEDSIASSFWGSPRSSPLSSPEPGYESPDQTGAVPPRSSTPHPTMPGVKWFPPQQEGSEMTRLPADITRVLAPRPSRATTTADEDDEPSITELCIRNQNMRRAQMFQATSAGSADNWTGASSTAGNGTNIRAPTIRQVAWAELPNISD